jgi:adenylosuccinate lyase
MENMALWHERDISHSSVERIIMPDSTILADYVLHRLANLLDNLRIHPENMDRNLMASGGLFFSQRVLTALVEEAKMPRQEAYVLVQKAAMESWETHTPFPDLVRADPEIAARISGEKLDSLFDPASYLRQEDMIFERVFGRNP